MDIYTTRIYSIHALMNSHTVWPHIMCTVAETCIAYSYVVNSAHPVMTKLLA